MKELNRQLHRIPELEGQVEIMNEEAARLKGLNQQYREELSEVRREVSDLPQTNEKVAGLLQLLVVSLSEVESLRALLTLQE